MHDVPLTDKRVDAFQEEEDDDAMHDNVTDMGDCFRVEFEEKMFKDRASVCSKPSRDATGIC